MIGALFLLVLLLSFSVAGFALGAAVFALFMVTARLPYVGGFFRFLINGPAPLAFPIKLCAWAVSSGAMLIGLGLYQLIAGPIDSPWEFKAIFAAACITVLRNLERSAFFNVYEHVDLRKVASYFGLDSADIGRLKQKVALQTYIDASVTNFFSLLVAFGLIVYSAAPLALVDVSGAMPSLGVSLLEPLRLLNIVQGGEVPYSGPAWQVMRGVAAFLIMLYLVLFISLGANLIDDAIRIAEADDAAREALAAEIAGAANAATAPADVPPDTSAQSEPVPPEAPSPEAPPAPGPDATSEPTSPAKS
jgi:hypothetical protein